MGAEIGTAVAVSVSQDKLHAYMQFIDPDTAAPLSEEDLEELLKANQIVYGIDRNALSAFAADPMAYVAAPVIAARGESAADGEDGYIENLFSTEGQERTPLVLEDGTVDYREILRLNNVSKGQLIARRVPATKGKPGTAVTGEAIPGKDGKEAHFKVGKNVVVDQERLNMYAVIDGLVTETDKGKLNVFPVYQVNGDVDFRVGNIDFIGNVVVRGNVLSGFKIKASGDIRITGSVEGAELEAEGSIEIASGIFAGNKGFVKAGVDVKSSFMQEAKVFAVRDIIVSQSILHSQVRAGRNVVCKGTKGLIVGGNIQAGELIEARTIGNSMSTPTALEVGVAPEIRDELQQLKVSQKQLADNAEKTNKALILLDQMALAGTLTPDKLALRTKLLATKRSTAEELAASKERVWEIESSLKDIDKAKVKVNGTIFAGTKIVIGRYTRFIKDSTTRATFQFHGGEITITSY